MDRHGGSYGGGSEYLERYVCKYRNSYVTY
jgi:hypothetical protein